LKSFGVIRLLCAQTARIWQGIEKTALARLLGCAGDRFAAAILDAWAAGSGRKPSLAWTRAFLKLISNHQGCSAHSTRHVADYFR
jgi:hypothetical protein